MIKPLTNAESHLIYTKAADYTSGLRAVEEASRMNVMRQMRDRLQEINIKYSGSEINAQEFVWQVLAISNILEAELAELEAKDG